MNKRASGFTIVELLIVIVVIAILVAIVIAAYTGIRDRASASRASSAVASYVKILRMHKVINGDFPSSTASPSGEYCLGNPSDFPADGVFAAGQCLSDSTSSYTVSTSQALANTLDANGQASNTRLPDAKLGPETWRGIRYSYNPAGSSAPIMEWIVNGSVPCLPGSGTPGMWWGSTWCELRL